MSNIGLNRVHHLVDLTESTSFPVVSPNSTTISGSIWEGNDTPTQRGDEQH
jgi:hypothetical protein